MTTTIEQIDYAADLIEQRNESFEVFVRVREPNPAGRAEYVTVALPMERQEVLEWLQTSRRLAGTMKITELRAEIKRLERQLATMESQQ